MKERKVSAEELICRQKEEAVKRMQVLRILGNVIKEFNTDGTLNASEEGILFWIDVETAELVKEFEKKSGNMVYHLIKNNLEWGVCYIFLFVSPRPSEWEDDRKELEEGYPLVYCCNVDSYGSEYDTIGIKPCFGGVLRTE